MRKGLFGLLVVIFFFFCWKTVSLIVVNDSPHPTVTEPQETKEEKTEVVQEAEPHLIWSDYFTGPEINPANWSWQTGGHGWGNNELQYYTDSPDNCYIENGCLIIKAIKENYQGNAYTSARITTKGKRTFSWGRIEIKAKLVRGKGLFPAFWLMPVNNTYGDYKKNGEIDIMEMLGQQANTIYGVAHFSYNKKYRSYGKFVSKSIDFSEDFHIFSLKWTPKKLTWFIDNQAYYSFSHGSQFPPDYQPFQQPFYLVINLAVGGDWPGKEIDSSALPAKLEIDYVKYYELVE